ncbi:ABC transporter substrate-binding protein [Candidatus Magnetomonas plexicatena]|uniref:ABC transporter substrate-binding protein n=1 Tax=Candidatus Magnetomonas plexicatena TaxID=2552947 RepID=UPI001C76ABA6|nr:ABC transporter substrate-binding protein [Nitrospirales bacterium LBB_01]
MKQPALLLPLLLILTVCVSSCGKPAASDGYLHLRINANPTTLDPAYVVDVAGGSICAKMFNGLVKLNENLDVIPDIAKSWKVSPDGLKYTFYLRDNVTFHNGALLTANDVEYSLKRLLMTETKSPNTWVVMSLLGAEEFLSGKSSTLNGIKVIDNLTIELTLKTPFAPFIKLLTMTPAYIVPQKEVERLKKSFANQPIGTGPFQFLRWEPDSELVLTRFPKYFESVAKIAGIRYRVIPEDLTTITEFMLGNLDVTDVTAASYKLFTTDKKYSDNLKTAVGLNTYYLGLNNSKPPLNNVVLRQAIAYAIDKDKILKTYFQGRGALAAGPIPDALKSYKLPERYPYNPELAKQLVKKSGYKKSEKLKFYINTAQDSIDIAEIIMSYLIEAGIEVEIKVLEWSAYKSAINNGESDLFWLGWWADYPDGENFLYPLFHSSNFGAGGNRTRFIDKRIDALIEEAQRTIDDNKRETLYKEIEQEIVEACPAVFFWHRKDFVVTEPWIKQFRLSAIYSIDKGNFIEIQHYTE